MAKNTKTLEEALEEVKEVIDKLERNDTSLDNSFKLYNDGIKLLKFCNDSIDKVEKKMVILNVDEIKQ